MMAIGWTMEMPNVPAKLRVLGVVKLLNAVSSVVVYYHYVLRMDIFLFICQLHVCYLHTMIGGRGSQYYSWNTTHLMLN